MRSLSCYSIPVAFLMLTEKVEDEEMKDYGAQSEICECAGI
jgi:hypothetical protein